MDVEKIKIEEANAQSMKCLKDFSIMFDGRMYEFKKNDIFNFSIDFKNHLIYNNLYKNFSFVELSKPMEEDNGKKASEMVSKSVKKS